jgi:hypothetical protein
MGDKDERINGRSSKFSILVSMPFVVVVLAAFAQQPDIFQAPCAYRAG